MTYEKPKGIEIYADSNRGIYIPQYFAQSIDRELISNIDVDDLAILESGPEHEHYWETWASILDNAIIKSPDGNFEYSLHQDGDLFLVDYNALSDAEYSELFCDDRD